MSKATGLRMSSDDASPQKEARTSAAAKKVSVIMSAEYAERPPIDHTRINSTDVFYEMYDAGAFLGQGSYGKVSTVLEKKSGITWACKEVAKERADTMALRMIDREIIILKKVAHPHIVALHEVYETPETTFIIMEICNGGTLEDVAIKKIGDATEGEPALTPTDVATVTRRLVRAVAYLHDNGIVHRDMKLENVMMKTRGELDVKICDFGLCAFLSKDAANMSIVCGTPAYMAPEVLANQGNYSPLCDVWSLGVMIYQMITGQMPFRPRYEGDTVIAVIKEVPIDLSHPSFEDTRIAHVVQAILREDPARRLTAKEVLDYPWVSGKEAGDCNSADVMQHGGVLDMMRLFAMEEEEAEADEESKSSLAGDGGSGSRDSVVSGTGRKSDSSNRLSNSSRNGHPGHPTRTHKKISKVEIGMGAAVPRPSERSPGLKGRYSHNTTAAATNGARGGKSPRVQSRASNNVTTGRRAGMKNNDDAASPVHGRKAGGGGGGGGKNVYTVRLPPLPGRGAANTTTVPAKNRKTPKRA
eukprot:m.75616 g.75616  ORF g.75616 m.75616 type:complete len:529 (-) comp9006_c0_seq2:1310-2896(-)